MNRKELDAVKEAIRNTRGIVRGNTEAMTANEILIVEPLILEWTQGAYIVGDIRHLGDQIYKCCQSHDSTNNPTYNPIEAPALWVAYHATSATQARPFVHPTGAHDVYMSGEYCIYNDTVYKCIMDNCAYSPDEYSTAWESQKEDE